MEKLARFFFPHLTEVSDVYSLAQCSRSTLRSFRALDPWWLTGLARTKKGRLQVFLNFYQHLPPQGSPGWLANKQGKEGPVFGGSEIGTLLGLNPWKTESQLLLDKLHLGERFTGNLATRWGNLFEEVLFQISDRLMGMKSEETGSIPGLRDHEGRVIQAYSPDRLGVVEVERFLEGVNLVRKASGEGALLTQSSLEELLGRELESEKEIILLLEGKCPLRREPGTTIPEQYLAQPLLGAATIPITELCLFVDGMFRRTSLTDFNFSPSFDTTLHRSARGEVLALGSVFFFERGIEKPREGELKEVRREGESLPFFALRVWESLGKMPGATPGLLVEQYPGEEKLLFKEILECFELLTLSSPLEGLEDFGENPLEGILEKAIEGRFSREGVGIYYPGEVLFSGLLSSEPEEPQIWLQKQAREFRLWAAREGHRALGVLPWKLFSLSLISQAVNPGFLKLVAPRIEEAANTVNEILAKLASLPQEEKFWAAKKELQRAGFHTGTPEPMETFAPPPQEYYSEFFSEVLENT